jgi:SAM-dependent methyltransferase
MMMVPMNEPSNPDASPTSGPGDHSGSADGRYWDSIADAWASSGRDTLWRDHSDAVNRNIVDGWMPTDRMNIMLKTDAFDEAVSDGLSKVLESRARTVVSMDGSLRVLGLARKTHGSILAVCCDVRQLPFATGSIDSVVSNSTLDHFPHTDHIAISLRELHRVLREGGPMMLTLDNPINPLIGLRQILPNNLLLKIGLVPYFVGATLGPSRLKRYLLETGFGIRRMGAILHCPRVLAVVVSRFVQRRGSARSQRRFLGFLNGFERLQRWPTRYLTGHYIAVNAAKSPHASPASPVRASGNRDSS